MNLNIDSVVDFAHSPIQPVSEVIDHAELLSLPYQAKIWTHYSSATGHFCAGIWEAEACSEKFVAEHEEYCHILQGNVRLTDERGESRTFGPNSHFTVPAGFTGLWENLGFVRKAFVIANPA